MGARTFWTGKRKHSNCNEINMLKIPPHSDEAEAGVLGSIILDPERFHTLELRPEQFYSSQNQILWENITAIAESGKPWDALLLGDVLKNNNALERCGGYDRLIELQDTAITPFYSQQYADIVKEKWRLRKSIEVLTEGTERAYAGEDFDEDVMAGLLALGAKCDKDKDIVEHSKAFLDRCKAGKCGHFGWWCDDWTQKLGRLDNDLMILHAPRSTGKTAMMLQWMVSSHQENMVSPLASIEMLKDDLAPRLMANVGDVCTFRMKVRGSVTPNEEVRSVRAIDKIKSLNLHIRDKGMSIEDIMMWGAAEKKAAKDGGYQIGAVFIDNLLSISDGGKRYDSKTLMYDYFIRKMRDLRNMLKTPVVLLAHPNQDGAVAWSKDVENFADIIMFMCDAEKCNKENAIDLDKVTGRHVVAKIQKFRNGITPTAHLDFIGETQTFKHIQWE